MKQFVVGNEPNQPASWRRSSTLGDGISAPIFGQYLATAYDALKAATRDQALA